MEYRLLGLSGCAVSALALGLGLLTLVPAGQRLADRQVPAR
jgi:hypothetical protein